jgi:electron transport protein HydN
VLAHSPEDALGSGTVDKDFHPRLKVIKTAKVSAPVQCRHCEDAPCANVCPTGAIINKNNTIQIESTACIGCKTCLLACPFGVMDLALQFVEGEPVWQTGLKVMDEEEKRDKENMIAYKCDLCAGRKAGPACAGVCPTKAFTAVEGQVMVRNSKQRRQASAEELSRIAIGNYKVKG